MKIFTFIKQYITMPRFVGAILPSSKYLASKMVEDIDFQQAEYIVEYGPGTGAFSENLIKSKKKNTVILLLEFNHEFYSILKEKYGGEPNVHIIHDSAENIDKYLTMYNIPWVDYFISGLPFASLPQNVSCAILQKTHKYIKKDGKFITFQYTMLKKSFIQQYFGEIDIKREVRNLPPAYVFSCSN